MATAAQIEANRLNAQSSTGPQSTEGKAASSSNAQKHGLFSTKTCVHHGEREEYQAMCAGLIETLHPVGHLEDMLVVDIIHCAWRLRRCGVAEENLTKWVLDIENEPADADASDPLFRAGDPVLYGETGFVQATIDRARTQAISSRRRAMADLAALQTERLTRSQILTGNADTRDLGIARVRTVLEGSRRSATQSTRESEKQMQQHLESLMMTRNPRQEKAIMEEMLREFHLTSRTTEQTQSDSPESPQSARNAPCPCNSGLKYKRCCGQNAPPVLGTAA